MTSKLTATEAGFPEKGPAMKPQPASITLVLGGARSGKSRFAQSLAARAGKDVVFLATARGSDEEMRAKIERHRRERPAAWKTVEVPLHLDDAVRRHGNEDTFLLIDCLTTFAANLMEEQGSEAAIFGRIESLVSALTSTAAPVAMVSNEVGNGVVPAYPSGCQFRNVLGEINQMVARVSRNVVVMIAGCPLLVKGDMELTG